MNPQIIHHSKKGQNHFSFVSPLLHTLFNSQPLDLLELISVAKIESFSYRCLTEEGKGLAFKTGLKERHANVGATTGASVVAGVCLS